MNSTKDTLLKLCRSGIRTSQPLSTSKSDFIAEADAVKNDLISHFKYGKSSAKLFDIPHTFDNRDAESVIKAYAETKALIKHFYELGHGESFDYNKLRRIGIKPNNVPSVESSVEKLDDPGFVYDRNIGRYSIIANDEVHFLSSCEGRMFPQDYTEYEISRIFRFNNLMGIYCTSALNGICPYIANHDLFMSTINCSERDGVQSIPAYYTDGNFDLRLHATGPNGRRMNVSTAVEFSGAVPSPESIRSKHGWLVYYQSFWLLYTSATDGYQRSVITIPNYDGTPSGIKILRIPNFKMRAYRPAPTIHVGSYEPYYGASRAAIVTRRTTVVPSYVSNIFDDFLNGSFEYTPDESRGLDYKLKPLEDRPNTSGGALLRFVDNEMQTFCDSDGVNGMTDFYGVNAIVTLHAIKYALLRMLYGHALRTM